MNPTEPTIQALRELGTDFDALEVQSPGLRRQRSRRIAGALALLVLAGFTPPGQAVAERVGELMGIGDVPREEGNYGTDPRIIGVGTTPTDHSYEAVISGEPGSDETCVFLGFVEITGTGFGTCVGQEFARDKVTALIYRAPEGILPEGGVVLQGLTTADVARVEITYTDESGAPREAPVEMSPVSADLLDELDLSDEPFGFYFTFLAPGAIGTPVSDQTPGDLRDVEIRAFDANGDQLAVQHLDDSKFEVWLDHATLGHLPQGKQKK